MIVAQRSLGFFDFSILALSLVSIAEEKQQTPIGPQWSPSPWGADDQRGAANRMNAEQVLKVTQLIKLGQVDQLGRVDERDMPTFPHRIRRLTIPACRKVEGENQRVGRDEFLENLDPEPLAANGVREFAFIFAPLRLKDATVSPGNPIAVR